MQVIPTSLFYLTRFLCSLVIIIQISLALLGGVCRNKQLVDGINFMCFTLMHAVRLKEALQQSNILFFS